MLTAAIAAAAPSTPISNAVLSGPTTFQGATVTVFTTMPALAVNMALPGNAYFASGASATFTYSTSTPTAGTAVLWRITAGGSDFTGTIPSTYSLLRAGNITTLFVPAGTTLEVKLQYLSSRMEIIGDPVQTTGTGPFVLQTGGSIINANLNTPAAVTLTNGTGLPDGGLALTDVTTNNVSITRHGFAPKAPNDATVFLDGTGNYSHPAGTGNVNAPGTLTLNGVVLGQGTTNVAVVAGISTDGVSVIKLGVPGTSVGGVQLGNATSGTLTLIPQTGALSGSVSIPSGTDTLANLAGTQTLTNKSIAASEINSGTLATARGGTNTDSSGSTGVAQLLAGVWSFSTALGNGTTATTQTAADNSTKVGTTAYADNTQSLQYNAQTGTTYTLALTDGAPGSTSAGVSMNNASANTLTVPANASVAFPIGRVIPVLQLGAGTTTITAAGGVTINAPGGLLTMAGQNSMIGLVKTATNTWQLTGQVSANAATGQTVAAGTSYTLTASPADVIFGTTSPITPALGATGTYLVTATIQTSLSGATYASAAQVNYNLRRTNNTAADISGTTFGAILTPVAITTITEIANTITISYLYTTANTTDTIGIRGVVSATPSAGAVTCSNATINAVWLHP